MTSQTTPNIRLVICPRCRKLLPEPDIPVYKCGGCGSVLKAKNRKTDTQGTGLSRDGADANKKRELDCVPDQKEISINQEATNSAGGESSSDISNDGNQDDFPNCNGKQLDCVPDQKEININQEATSSAGGELSPDISNNRNQDDFPDCNVKQLDCVPDQKEISINQEATSSAGGESSSDISNNGNQDDFPDCNGKQLDCVPDQKEISINQETTSSAGGESSPDISKNRNQDDFSDCNVKQLDCVPDQKEISINQEATSSAGGESSSDISNNGNQDDFPNCNGKQLDCVPDQKEISINQEATSSAGGESSSDISNNGNQDDFPNCNGKQLDCVPDQKEISINQEATSSAGGELPPDISNNRNQDDFPDCNVKQLDCVPDQKEISINQEATSSAGGESSSDISNNGNQDDFPDCNGKQLDCVPDQKEISINQETTSSAGGESSPDISNNRNQDDFSDCNVKQLDCVPDQKEISINQEATSSAGGESSSDISNNGNQDDFPDCNGKQQDCVPDQKVISINQEAASSEGGESSPDISNNRNQDDFPDCNGKQHGDKNFSYELPDSFQLSSRENEDLSQRVGEQIEQAHCEYNSDQATLGYENEFSDSKRNWSRRRSFSDDFYSSMEFPCYETEDSSPELQANRALRESNTTLDHCVRVDLTAREDCIGEQHEDTDFHSKVSSLTEDKLYENHFSPKGGALEERDEGKCISQHVGSSNERKFEGHGREFPNNADASLKISSSTVVVPKKPPSVVEENSEIEENLGGHVLGSLNKEDSLAKKETDSSDTDENPLDETIPLDNVDSPDDQQLGASQRMIPRGFGHASSEDTLDNLPLVNFSSEVGLKNIKLSKSPTRSYYGNDGSASSCDGFENRIPGRCSKPPKRKLKHANFNNSDRLQRENGPAANDVLSSKLEIHDQTILGSGSEVQNQASKSSILPEKSHPTMKYKNHQDDLQEPRSYGRSSGSRIREDKDEHVSKLRFIPKYSLTGHRKGNPSHYPYNVLHHYSGFCAPDAPSYTDPDKLELLRMVHELKDELNKMHISNSRFPPTVIRGDKYTPLFYDRHQAPMERISADLLYSRYSGRYSQGKGLPQLHKARRVAFSGDAADYRCHVDCSCLHCHPQDWQRSVQLPSHSICCNKVHCVAHSSTCYNGQCSTSSSPQHYKSSEFNVWDCEIKSDDQRHRDSEMTKLHSRQRYHSAKRHLRPVAGGTPIVACYHCSELLQLPADFLLLGRRCHKLRCNACRNVMKFSLHSSTHLVPCITDAVAPPPSMVDDCSESIRQRNWASTSHSNENPYAEPLSCTDDYGFDRSFSTEGEPSLITPPLHPVERNSRYRNSSSGNSVMPLDDRKMKSALGECQKMHTSSEENLGSVGPSSKRSKWRKSSSGMKELPPSGGSPLHRLMGYSSPSAVMKN